MEKNRLIPSYPKRRSSLNNALKRRSILFEILNAVVEIGVMLLKESFSGPK